MPSPFPGVDPFLEGQNWEDLHGAFLLTLRNELVKRLRPRYVIGVEETILGSRKVRQRRLRIVRKDALEVVTVLELLSPWNKTGEGRAQYLARREAALLSTAHLVELDLLRGGERQPTVEPLPVGDFYALVCRRPQRPKVDVYAWGLRSPLPSIPIPLCDEDSDCVVDLQAIFVKTYDDAGYDYALDYASDVAPPLLEADAAWVRGVLQSARSAEPRPATQ